MTVHALVFKRHADWRVESVVMTVLGVLTVVCALAFYILFVDFLGRVGRPGADWKGAVPEGSGAWAVHHGPERPFHYGACAADPLGFEFRNTTRKFKTPVAFAHCTHLNEYVCPFVGMWHGENTRCVWIQTPRSRRRASSPSPYLVSMPDTKKTTP